jgi:hypothetical protein
MEVRGMNRAAVAASILIQCAIANGAPEAVDPFLKAIVDDLNSNLPATIDRNTRLDTAKAGPNRRITYYYTITTHDVSGLDVNKLRATLIPASRNKLCTSPNTRALLDAKVVYVYHYSDRSGRFVTNFETALDNCK